MKIHILTIFPDFFTSPFGTSILKRAQDSTRHSAPPLDINIVNIRDFTTDKHHMTDDRPYGGGAGMVMKIESIHNALKSLQIRNSKSEIRNIEPNSNSQIPKNAQQTSSLQSPTSKVILTSARGRLFTQQVAREYAQLEELVIICGHYEGVDQRVSDHLVDEEVRIGDYVLTGGEPAAIVITDAVTRLLPNVLGNEESAIKESHSTIGYFEHPHYTRPEVYNGWKVPKVLLNGNHKEIEEWRKNNYYAEPHSES